jgi:hypothetical protein
VSLLKYEIFQKTRSQSFPICTNNAMETIEIYFKMLIFTTEIYIALKSISKNYKEIKTSKCALN